jgi:hypothetical protein
MEGELRGKLEEREELEEFIQLPYTQLLGSKQISSFVCIYNSVEKEMAELTHTFGNSHVESAVLLYNTVSLLHKLHTCTALLYFWCNQQQTSAQLHTLPTGCTAWTPVTPVCHRTHRICLGVRYTMAQNRVLKEKLSRF